MSTTRGKPIGAALALALVIALVVLIVSAQRSGAQAYSTDKRLKIYDVRYFPGTNYDYSFFPTRTQWFKYQWQKLFRTVSINTNASQPVAPINQRGVGPALLICGELVGGEMSFFKLVTERGEEIHQLTSRWAAYSRTDYARNRFVCRFALSDPKDRYVQRPLTDGTYRLRFTDETNDLAIIRVR